jgi:uncharacterized protein (TIGR02453 family)
MAKAMGTGAQKSAREERFDGFADATGKFFKALGKHQDRDWFLAHKTEYEEGWETPMKRLFAEMRQALDRAYPHSDLADPRVLRIYRDVRFSSDKSPYKTHIGASLATKRAGGKAGMVPAALYLHIGADEMFAAAGLYMMEPPNLARFRSAVVDDGRGKELAKILARLEKKGFEVGGHGALKKVPKGFDPEHPRAELLKYKGIHVDFGPLPRKALTSRAFVDWLVPRAKDAAPFVEWLVFATA